MGWLPIIFYLIIGLALLVALGLPRRSLHAAGVLALAWIVGMNTVTIVIMTAALATGRFYFGLFWIMLAACAAFLVWKRRDLRELFTLEIVPAHEVIPASRLGRGLYWAACALLAVAILTSIYWVMSFGLTHPLAMSDALTNFAHKARLWFDTRQLMPDLLKDPEYLMYKRRYPAAIPLTEAVWSFIFGGWDGVRLKFIFMTSWIAIGGLIFSMLMRRTGLLAGLLGAAIWMTLPFHLTHPWGGPIDGFADQTYALAMMAGIVIATLYDRERGWPFVVLAGLAAAGGLVVKQEGVIAWGLIFLYFLWRRAPLRHLAIIAGVMIYIMALNKLTTRGLPDHFEGDLTFNLPIAELMDRVGQLPSLLWIKLTNTLHWGPMLWFVIVAFLVFRLIRTPWRRLPSLELFVFAALAGIYMTVIMFTARDFENNFDWSFQRLFIHILPLLCVITFSDFRLAVAEQTAGAGSLANEAVTLAAATPQAQVTLADAAGLRRYVSLYSVIVVVCLAMILVQTRENRSIAEDRHDDIKEARKDPIVSPLGLITRPWNKYGQAIELMEKDGSEKFWFYGERHFYAPKFLNLYLYPRHGIYMSMENQMQLTRLIQYGIQEHIRDVPPTKYDRILNVSRTRIEIVEESEIGLEQ